MSSLYFLKVIVSGYLFHISDKGDSAVATIVIRGSTENIMDDIERAVDDGVNTFKALTKVSSGRTVVSVFLHFVRVDFGV